MSTGEILDLVKVLGVPVAVLIAVLYLMIRGVLTTAKPYEARIADLKAENARLTAQLDRALTLAQQSTEQNQRTVKVLEERLSVYQDRTEQMERRGAR